MGDAWLLGPLMIKEQWVMFFTSGLVAYIIIRIGLSRKLIDRSVLDALWNALIVFGVVWKLSYTLFHPIDVWNHPLSQLYFTGGDKGLVLALAVVFFYFVYRGKKEHLTLNRFIEPGFIAFLVGFGSYQCLMLTGFHFFTLYSFFQILLSLVLVIFWFIKISRVPEKTLWPGMILWFCIGELLLSYMEEHAMVWFGFSLTQWVFIVLGLIMIFISYRIKDNFNKT